jgi:uncharacterized damage-inducible protein DinB
MSELKNIVTLLENTFGNNPWHGPSVKDALRNITPVNAMQRLNNSHSIIELVNHMTTWRNYTIKKLGSDIAFEMTQEQNFPAEKDWSSTQKNLGESQTKLIAVINAFDRKKLSETVPLSKYPYSYYAMLHGIIHHDLYHTGQIMIIKKHFGI